MLYVILSKDIRSKDGKLYAKRGKCLAVLFKNKNHYLCEVGKYSIPVFPGQVEKEVTQLEYEQETIEATENEAPEGCGSTGEDQDGEILDHLRN